MNYNTVAKVYTDGKFSGFQVINERSEKIEINLSEMDKILADPDVSLDIVKCGRGWKFKDSSKTMDMLPVIKNGKHRASINPNKANNLQFFANSSLKDMIKISSGGQPVRGECSIHGYMVCANKGLVCTVSGLVCTGRKTLVKYELDSGDYVDSTVWIKVTGAVSSKEVEDAYNAYYKSYKVIVIEEANAIKDLHKAKWLIDLSNKGRKVILIVHGDIFYKTYTNSVLRNRIYSVYTTPVTYSDYKFMNFKSDENITVSEYSRMGELNCNPVEYYGLGGMRDLSYFNTKDDILTDIQKAVAPNDEAFKWLGFNKTHKENARNLRNIIMTILQEIICDRAINPISTHKNNLCTVDFSLVSAYYDINIFDHTRKFFEVIGENLNVTYNEVVDKETRFRIIAMLESMSIMLRVNNIYTFGISIADSNIPNNVCRYKYYFTNPAIVNRAMWMLCSEIDKQYVPKIVDAAISNHYGFIYESAIMTSACQVAKDNDFKCYFYRDELGREIDMVFISSNTGNVDIKLCEIKSCDDAELLVSKNRLKWIGNTYFDTYFKQRYNKKFNLSRCVVYPGADREVMRMSSNLLFKNDGKFLETVWQDFSEIKL